MCGRYTLTEKDIGVVADALGARYDDELRTAHQPRFNIAPSQPAPMVRLEDGGRWLRLGSFGLVAPDRKLSINARAESVATRPGIRDAFARRRCVVPADGFFEWQGERAARRPLWFHARDGGPIYFAGLWEPETSAGATPSFLILTTRPNDVVAKVHDRMPAILPRERALDWLSRPDTSLLAPAPDDWLIATPVSTRVNNANYDDPTCLAPPDDAAPSPGQLRLL